MAHLSQCGPFVHTKVTLRTIGEHCADMLLCQARHFHQTRFACFTQAHASCLKYNEVVENCAAPGGCACGCDCDDMARVKTKSF